MKYIITLLSIAAAFASYIVGSVSGLVALTVAGVIFEGVFWRLIFRRNH